MNGSLEMAFSLGNKQCTTHTQINECTEQSSIVVNIKVFRYCCSGRSSIGYFQAAVIHNCKQGNLDKSLSCTVLTLESMIAKRKTESSALLQWAKWHWGFFKTGKKWTFLNRTITVSTLCPPIYKAQILIPKFIPELSDTSYMWFECSVKIGTN